jgi:hypothetical protein
MKIKTITVRDKDGNVLSLYENAPPPPILTPRTTGLGDVVAKVADPIARALDAALGTKLAGCGGCSKRRRALNRLVPDVRNPLQRRKG